MRIINNHLKANNIALFTVLAKREFSASTKWWYIKVLRKYILGIDSDYMVTLSVCIKVMLLKQEAACILIKSQETMHLVKKAIQVQRNQKTDSNYVIGNYIGYLKSILNSISTWVIYSY